MSLRSSRTSAVCCANERAEPPSTGAVAGIGRRDTRPALPSGFCAARSDTYGGAALLDARGVRATVLLPLADATRRCVWRGVPDGGGTVLVRRRPCSGCCCCCWRSCCWRWVSVRCCSRATAALPSSAASSAPAKPPRAMGRFLSSCIARFVDAIWSRSWPAWAMCRANSSSSGSPRPSEGTASSARAWHEAATAAAIADACSSPVL